MQMIADDSSSDTDGSIVKPTTYVNGLHNCPDCDFTTMKGYNMKRHQKSHHGDDDETLQNRTTHNICFQRKKVLLFRRNLEG